MPLSQRSLKVGIMVVIKPEFIDWHLVINDVIMEGGGGEEVTQTIIFDHGGRGDLN